MRATRLIAAGTIAIGLWGCASKDLNGWALAEEGERCDVSSRDGKVHIEIRYAADGTPTVLPRECTVASGTRITWRGPAGRAAPFVLRFHEDSPVGRGNPRELRSGESQQRQKIVLVSGEAQGRYRYDIEAGGIAAGPAIVIAR